MYGNSEEGKEDEYRVFPYTMSEVLPWFSFKDSWYCGWSK